MSLIKLVDAINYIKDPVNKDKEVNISFLKKDGTVRRMKAKYGFDDGSKVHNPLNPGLPFKQLGLVSVYDVDAKEYRCFAEKRLLSLQINNQWYSVEENSTIKV